MENATAVPEQTQENETPEPTETVLARVDALELKRAAMNLKKIVPRKTTLPVLSLAKVDTRDGVLTLTVTDLDTSLVLQVGEKYDVANPGVASCDPRELKKVLTSTNADTVELRVSSDAPGLILEAGDVRFTFNGLPEDEFPQLPDVDGQEQNGGVTMEAERWAAIGDRVTPFASVEESRPILHGVLFERTETHPWLSVVATNGHHMMIMQPYETEIEAVSKELSAIIPHEALKPLRLILKRAGVDGDSFGQMDVGENHARLSFPGVTILTRLVEGPYPNWRQVVPSERDFVGATNLPREKTLEAVKTVEVATDRADRTVWELTPHTKVMVSADATDGPSAEAVIPGTSYEPVGDNHSMRISFNANYMKMILNAHTANTLRLRVAEPERAAMIEPQPEDGWRTLLMPLRILD